MTMFGSTCCWSHQGIKNALKHQAVISERLRYSLYCLEFERLKAGLKLDGSKGKGKRYYQKESETNG